MADFEKYSGLYENIQMRRENGIIEMALHLDGGPLLWNEVVHKQLPEAFYNVGLDLENRVVILTGTGDAFCPGMKPGACQFDGSVPPVALDKVYREGRALILNQLAVPVPMIAAVNGPATAHCELALFCDIVIAADTTVFQDLHLEGGIVPGDGIHIAFPLAFGVNRGRYLALTCKAVSAAEALEWGAVNEVLPMAQVRQRAWEIAAELARRPILSLRYSREILVKDIQRQCHDNLSLGLALEGFASGYGSWPS